MTIIKIKYLCPTFEIAGVVKLVDTLDLGSSAARLGGSSPFTRTFFESMHDCAFISGKQQGWFYLIILSDCPKVSF